MAKKVNRKMIGGFVVVAVGILAASIAIFGSGDMFRERIEFVLYFDDSIKGLNVGARVLTKGVRTGTVKQIVVRTFMDDLRSTVAVFIEIYPESFDVVTPSDQHLDPLTSLPGLIDKGLRAQLVSQSMVTGQLSIEFFMRPDTPANLKNLDKGILEIPTIPSTLSRLERQLQQIDIGEMYERLSSILDSLDSSLKNLNLETTGSELSSLVGDIRQLVDNMDSEMKSLAENLNEAVTDSRGVIVEMRDEIKPIAEKTNETLVEVGAMVRTVGDKAEPLAQSLTDALEAATAASMSVNDIVAETSPTRANLDSALEQLASASRSLRILAEYLEQHPDALLKGKGYQNY
ncbi:MAG: MlaD family protein [Desulfofustis sp.]